jgi:hypothetical protein
MMWNAKMDAVINKGHKQGLSARLIADQLGTTRNAVLGRVFRLGLGGSPDNPYSPSQKAISDRSRQAAIRRAEDKQRRERRFRVKRLIETIRLSAPVLNATELTAIEAIAGNALRRAGVDK